MPGGAGDVRRQNRRVLAILLSIVAALVVASVMVGVRW